MGLITDGMIAGQGWGIASDGRLLQGRGVDIGHKDGGCRLRGRGRQSIRALDVWVVILWYTSLTNGTRSYHGYSPHLEIWTLALGL